MAGEITITRPEGQTSYQSVLISRELWRRLIDYRVFRTGTDGEPTKVLFGIYN